MKKFILTLVLVACSVMLIGCASEPVSSVEIYNFPEGTHRIEIIQSNHAEVKRHIVGKSEYSADDNTLDPIFDWYNDLVLVEIDPEQAEILAKSDSGQTYKFFVDGENVFTFIERGAKRYIIFDSWYQVEVEP